MQVRYPQMIGSRCFAFSLLLIALLPVVGLAQRATSGLNGVVTDSSGAVVPKVTVTLTSESERYVRTTVSDSAGVYVFSDLTPGVYNISAQAPSFKKVVVTGIRLFVGHDVVQNLMLELGTVTQQVSVIATAPLLRQNTAEVGTVIEGKALTDIPLNGRSFTQLNFLLPGVSTDKNNGSPSGGNQLNAANMNFNVNGAWGSNNMFFLDGAPFKDYQQGQNIFAPNVDAIQEFITASSNYAADMGVEAGGQVSMVLKSGTNQLHGDVFEFVRNDKFDARNFFAAQRPPFRQNQFGGVVGGPIVKNKTFFFSSYEGLRHAKSVATLENFPTAGQLAGDLSTLVTPGTPLVNPFTGMAFTGNKIPQSMMPSTLEPFLQNGIGNGPWVPAPNTSQPGGDYLYNVPEVLGTDQVMGRIDQRVGSQTFLFGHYVYENESGTDLSAFPGRGLSPSWSTFQRRRANNVAFHIAKPMTNNFLFDFSFGYSRTHQARGSQLAVLKDVSGSILGIKSGIATGSDSWGAPRWRVTGYNWLGEATTGPSQWKNNVVMFRPAFTLIKGKHTMKFGAEVNRYLETFSQISSPNGDYTYNGGFTGYPLGDFLLGLPHTVTLSPTYVDPQEHYSGMGYYFQDDWKVTPHFVLNLGLRYEWLGIPFSATRSIVGLYLSPNWNTDPQLVLSDGAKPLVYNGVQQTFMPGVAYTYASKVGMPESLGWNDNKDFGPRFGFAYTVPSLSNTVVRGGFGIFYQRDVDNKWVDGSINPPFDYTISYGLDNTNFQNFNFFDPAHLGTAAPLGLYANDPHYKAGRIEGWNLTLEHSAMKTLFSAAYVGNAAWHLANLQFLNGAQPPGPGSYASRERWPDLGQVYWNDYQTPANYNGLQVKVQHPFSNGLQLLASYTWSKTIDIMSGSYGSGEGCGSWCVQNTYNIKMDGRGPADQDVPQRFVISYMYQLPVGRGKRWVNQGGVANAVIGGWQMNGITTFQSGNPFTVDQACDRLNTNIYDSRPDLVGNPNNGPRTVAQWFNTSAFRAYCPGSDGPFNYGNAGRGIVSGPGISNWDFALYKSFPIRGEEKRVEFRAESFNLFNHPDFNQPSSTAGTSTFGTISSTYFDNREIQFGVKLYF